MTMGLIFLIFLPIGIPLSLLIIPFLAGRNGARELPNDWHLTFILTVGGGWSIGLIVVLMALLSVALGPALRINVIEVTILASVILFTWSSFTIGVTSSKIKNPSPEKPFEQEWKDEEEQTENNDLSEMAVTQPEKKELSSFEEMKTFLSKKNNEEPSNTKNDSLESNRMTQDKKEIRVSALANRRRK